jgi:hypothetical protein
MVNSMMDPDLRQEIARLSAEHDVLLAKDQQPIESPPMRRDARDAGLLFRITEDALVPVAAAVAVPSTAADDENAKNAADWDRWVKAYLAIERTEVLDQVARIVGQFASEYVFEKLQPLTRELGVLRNENTELRGLLASALGGLDVLGKNVEAIVQERTTEKRERVVRDETIRERSARIAELQRQNAESRTELARKHLDQAFAERDSRITLLEQQLQMALRYMSLVGLEPPRGGF